MRPGMAGGVDRYSTLLIYPAVMYIHELPDSLHQHYILVPRSSGYLSRPQVTYYTFSPNSIGHPARDPILTTTIPLLAHTTIAPATGAPERFKTLGTPPILQSILSHIRLSPRPTTSPPLSSSPNLTMSTTTTISKPNVGVYTNPAHELWVSESEPSLETIKKGEDLKDGQVTIAIKSTGICGFDHPSPPALLQFSSHTFLRPPRYLSVEANPG